MRSWNWLILGFSFIVSTVIPPTILFDIHGDQFNIFRWNWKNLMPYLEWVVWQLAWQRCLLPWDVLETTGQRFGGNNCDCKFHVGFYKNNKIGFGLAFKWSIFDKLIFYKTPRDLLRPSHSTFPFFLLYFYSLSLAKRQCILYDI